MVTDGIPGMYYDPEEGIFKPIEPIDPGYFETIPPSDDFFEPQYPIASEDYIHYQVVLPEEVDDPEALLYCPPETMEPGMAYLDTELMEPTAQVFTEVVSPQGIDVMPTEPGLIHEQGWVYPGIVDDDEEDKSGGWSWSAFWAGVIVGAMMILWLLEVMNGL